MNTCSSHHPRDSDFVRLVETSLLRLHDYDVKLPYATGPRSTVCLEGFDICFKIISVTGMVCEPEFFPKINSRDSLTQ